MGPCRCLITKHRRTRNNVSSPHQLGSSNNPTSYKSHIVHFGIKVLGIEFIYRWSHLKLDRRSGREARSKGAVERRGPVERRGGQARSKDPVERPGRKARSKGPVERPGRKARPGRRARPSRKAKPTKNMHSVYAKRRFFSTTPFWRDGTFQKVVFRLRQMTTDLKKLRPSHAECLFLKSCLAGLNGIAAGGTTTCQQAGHQWAKPAWDHQFKSRCFVYAKQVVLQKCTVSSTQNAQSWNDQRLCHSWQIWMDKKMCIPSTRNDIFFSNSFLKGRHISKSSVSSTRNGHWLWKLASLSCRMRVFEIMSAWCIPLHNWTEMAWTQTKSRVRWAHLQSRIRCKVSHDGSLGDPSW